MVLERVWKGLLAVGAVLIVGILLVQVGLLPGPWTVDDGEVRIMDGSSDDANEEHEAAADDNETDAAGGNETGEDEPKAVVDVEVADTRQERYTGLSDHESLEDGKGMLFVHDDEDERTYVMREMDFDIDIIFIDADREITEIHHARAPEPGEDGEDLRYSGRAKWVLEVPRGYTNETGIEVGDEVEIDLESNETIITAGDTDTLERFASTADREPADHEMTDARSVTA